MVISGGGPDYNVQARGMFDLPHVDGQVIFATDRLSSNSTNLVLTRGSAGVWSLNRTAGGAETYYVRSTIDMITRLGEVTNNNTFGVTPGGNAPTKGIYITSIFVVYTVGVVSLTSATLRLGQTTYANNVATSQADILAATTVGAGNLAAQANPYVIQLLVASPVYVAINPYVLAELEFNFVMANTGTIAVAVLGMNCSFNYT